MADQAPEPQKAKALLRLLFEEMRVTSRNKIHPTYRLATPAVCAMYEKSGAAGNRTRVPRPRNRASTSVVRGLDSVPAGPRTAAAGS
jgi:hypothetical protein